MIAAVLTVVAGLALAGAGIAGDLSLGSLGSGGAAKSSQEAPVTRQILYTARTSTDAEAMLPATVRSDLRASGLRHEAVSLTQVQGDAATTTSLVDLTPRAGSTSEAPVLKVADRAVAAVNARIAGIEAAIRGSRSVNSARALFAGLTRTTFTGVPVIIVSSGLDLSSPDDFRDLAWTVTPDRVVATVRAAGELPDMAHAPVTFVVVPPAGGQEQLRQAQQQYRNAVWRALLTAAGASSVTFVDAPLQTGATGNDTSGAGTRAGSTGTAAAAAVPLPPLPDTPVQPVTDPQDPRRTLCALPTATYFAFDRADLLNPGRAAADLRPCLDAALWAGADIALDGWTSYEGPLTADGKPSTDDPHNRRLSQERVEAIARLLTTQLQLPPARIIHAEGHGNLDPPHPDPRDPANRIVIVSYVTP